MAPAQREVEDSGVRGVLAEFAGVARHQTAGCSSLHADPQSDPQPPLRGRSADYQPLHLQLIEDLAGRHLFRQYIQLGLAPSIPSRVDWVCIPSMRSGCSRPVEVTLRLFARAISSKEWFSSSRSTVPSDEQFSRDAKIFGQPLSLGLADAAIAIHKVGHLSTRTEHGNKICLL